ncbi:unnamed protein product [Trichobilharzia szidati]|nr:unnamed protein product [Trichobilharzia szidati]
MVLFMLCIFLCTYEVSGSTLTFELEDRSKQCFYEDFDQGTNFTVQFHVISGGNYDVDAELRDPSRKVIFSANRSPMDTFFVEDSKKGTYRICFSNSFSTLTHKIVSLSWFNGSDEAHWANVGGPSIDTTLSVSLNNIQTSVHKAVAQQYETRVFLTRSFSYAMALNARVLYLSIFLAIVIILFSIGQVLVMRSFFASPSPKSFVKPVPSMPGTFHTPGF